ncbi:HEPN domain-containing protein [Sporomusa sp.]|uniref:HEPN domain-containing protein n=1 Tax=Sporomusa sp. TaxID=2078658 RepID=UPI002D06BBAA|nr:HEPN domain-containing protein [Sporomusa sp.]HWR07348.1 HEPN domain-containing protein [Sporomusa sp.]
MQAEMLELAKYRLNKAEECLADSQDAYEKDRLANSINRSYYAMFHATRALLALDSFDSKRYSAIIGCFNQHYIATGKIDTTYYQMLSNAFRVRNKTDYDDFYVVSRDEAQQQLENAISFIAMLKLKITQLGKI